MAEVQLFGVRHHGPGSARSLQAALQRFQPDCLLIEGPADVEEILPLAAAEGMEPPVALLVYCVEEPRRAALFPYAAFSPEWIALHHALAAGSTLRFIDLPQAIALALEEEAPDDEEIRVDPLSELARAAGYDDGERWWDSFVESCAVTGDTVFAAVAEAMATLREAYPDRASRREEAREAYMRAAIRKADKEGFQRIAVVCGAWHVPALATYAARGQSGRDSSSLSGLSKVKTAAAWAPWSYDRLAAASGYRAGVLSPEWYDLLWHHGGEGAAARWLARTAQLLRDEDLEASPASVIEATRLAETLASLRGRSRPTLEDLEQSALTTLCFADPAPLRLVRRKLVIGDRLGRIADQAPVTPIQADLARQAKRLRLPFESSVRALDLDLRNENDLARSRLLHRLRFLGVPWGERSRTKSSRGTFREEWALAWKPDFVVLLVAASQLGSTIEQAAAASAAALAREATSVTALASLIGRILDADLDAEIVAQVLGERVALATDLFDLMGALPPLATVARYGSVRAGAAEKVRALIEGIVPRIAIGLVSACQSLDDEAAVAARRHLDDVQQALALLQDEALEAPWTAALVALAGQDRVNGHVVGRATRLLLDGGRLEREEIRRRMGLALSGAVEARAAAAWIEGFLDGSGAILIHDRAFWALIDDWLTGLGAEPFLQTLPLVRRTFSTFSTAERRILGEKLGKVAVAGLGPAEGVSSARAAQVLPVLRQLFGET